MMPLCILSSCHFFATLSWACFTNLIFFFCKIIQFIPVYFSTQFNCFQTFFSPLALFASGSLFFLSNFQRLKKLKIWKHFHQINFKQCLEVYFSTQFNWIQHFFRLRLFSPPAPVASASIFLLSNFQKHFV